MTELAQPSLLLRLGPTFVDEDYRSAVQVAKEAYIWGYPLVQTGEYWRLQSELDVPLNSVLVTEHYSSVETPAPSLEVLYGFIYLDLTDGPQVLRVPDGRERYYSIMLVDGYTNVFQYIGTRETKGLPGNFAILPPGWSGELASGIQGIRSPHNRILGVLRTYVENEDDFDAAREFQKQYALGPLSHYPNGLKHPLAISIPLMVQMQPMLRFESYGPAFFDIMCQRMEECPWPADEADTVARFALIGIGPGLTPSKTLDSRLLQALRDGIRLGEAEITSKDCSIDANGWRVVYDVTSRFWSPIYRAFACRGGVGYHTAEENIYFTCMYGPDDQLLTGGNRYELRFGPEDFPPVEAFWSLSLIGQDNAPVPNPLNRWAITSKTKGLSFGDDGSLTIVIQKDPPESGMSNWLPAPEGPFRVTIRTYIPSEAIKTGKWLPPRLKMK